MFLSLPLSASANVHTLWPLICITSNFCSPCSERVVFRRNLGDEELAHNRNILEDVFLDSGYTAEEEQGKYASCYAKKRTHHGAGIQSQYASCGRKLVRGVGKYAQSARDEWVVAMVVGRDLVSIQSVVSVARYILIYHGQTHCGPYGLL